MSSKIFLIAITSLALTACNNQTPEPKSHNEKNHVEHPERRDVNNTRINVRDRDSSAVTADQQSENATDRTITQKIRENVVKHDNFSTYAKNVKIITQNGVVTLRGPVNTDQEKADIANIAKQVAGVSRVVNEIEVVAHK